MSHRSITFAAALTMTVSALAPASASEAVLERSANAAFSVPAVIGAAYHKPGVALSAADVRAQGGLLMPTLTHWRRAPQATASAEPFKAPATITAAYRSRNIAMDAAHVLKQGGFATAGVVRRLPNEPVAAEIDAGTVKLGSL